MYLPPHLVTKLLEVTHNPGLSNHWSVCVKLELLVNRLQLPPKAPSAYWKLNSSILNHESFLLQFTRLFQQLEEEIQDFSDEAEWWDYCAKPASTSFCKSFSASLARQRKTFNKFLFALLRHATTKENWELVAKTKEKINVIVKQEAFGLVVRFCDSQNAEEEAASIYHLNKVRKGTLEKLKVAEDGTLGFKKNMGMVTTQDSVKIEEETVLFMDSLLNGRQDEHMQDTGVVFQPD